MHCPCDITWLSVFSGLQLFHKATIVFFKAWVKGEPESWNAPCTFRPDFPRVKVPSRTSFFKGAVIILSPTVKRSHMLLFSWPRNYNLAWKSRCCDSTSWSRSYTFKKLVVNLVVERGRLSYPTYLISHDSCIWREITHWGRFVIHRNISVVQKARSWPGVQGPANVDGWCFLFVDRFSGVQPGNSK